MSDRISPQRRPPSPRPARTRLALLAAALVMALPAVTFAATHARAELSSPQLAVDTPAQLTITIDGERGGTTAPSIHVPGATIQSRGQMARTTIVNGAATNETSFVYTVVPERPGPLDIPSVEVMTSAGPARTDAIHATVTRSTGAAPAASTGANITPEPARAEPTRAFVRLDLPARKLYVGEAIPVKIRAYFRAGTAAATQGPPKLSSDAFTLTDLSDKPAQTEVVLHGEPYLQATWTGILSPAKPMTGKLGVELPVEIAYRERVQRPHRSIEDILGRDPFAGMDPFADPFSGADPFAGFDVDIDSMFDTGTVQRRETTLRATAGSLTVLEPPRADRPAAFTGAVGTFELAIDPPTGEATVGEPITLAIRATGSGNFDRLSTAGVAESDGWKAYPVKSAFAPAASGRPAGTKTFTQTIVPTRAGTMEVPGVEIAYFDPVKRAYVIEKTEPLQLEVLPARGAVVSSDADPTNGSASAPVLAAPGETHASLQPMVQRPSFWFLPGGLALVTTLLVAAAWWRRSPRIAGALASRRLRRAIDGSLARMDTAAAANDAAAFFGAARSALQLRLSDQLGIAPEAITANDVESHLGSGGTTVRSIFEHADDVAYAHSHAHTPGTARLLDQWRTVVRDELARLEARS